MIIHYYLPTVKIRERSQTTNDTHPEKSRGAIHGKEKRILRSRCGMAAAESECVRSCCCCRSSGAPAKDDANTMGRHLNNIKVVDGSVRAE